MIDGGEERREFMQKCYVNGTYVGERLVVLPAKKRLTIYDALFNKVMEYAVGGVQFGIIFLIFIILTKEIFNTIFAFNFPDMPAYVYSINTFLIIAIVGAMIGLIAFCYDIYRYLNE